MGPGFSAMMCGGLWIAYSATASTTGLAQAAEIGVVNVLPFIWFVLALVVAMFNIIQMIPVSPLDGGRVLEAIADSTGTCWARRMLVAVGALTCGFLMLDGQIALTLICMFGCYCLAKRVSEGVIGDKMTRIETAAIAAGYVAALVIFTIPFTANFDALIKGPEGQSGAAVVDYEDKDSENVEQQSTIEHAIICRRQPYQPHVCAKDDP